MKCIKINTYVCCALRLDRGDPKILKEKIKWLKKGETNYRHKSQVLVQVWRDKREVKLDFCTTQSGLWRQKRRTGRVKQ